MTNDWPQPPKSGSRGEFIFVVVDVIDSSRLFKNKLADPELLEHHEALNRVYEHVRQSFHLEEESPYEWNWAGDGGVLAFPANVPGTTDKVLKCALNIATLESGKCRFCVPFELQVRTILDRGEAYYHDTKAKCRSGSLNFAAKARLPGKRMSLTITKEVYENLDDPLKDTKFRPIVLADENATRVYGYLPLMVDAFDKEIENTCDHAQAAHLAYRLGVLHFSEGSRGLAHAAFEKAIDHLEMIGPKHRYFHRTLREFYGLWQMLADNATDALLQHPERRDHLSLLRSSAFRAFRTSPQSGQTFQLLLEMEAIIEQLDVLASKPVNNPIGLTSLEICLLLERIGYPRRWYGAAVYDRIQRIKSEMAADQEKTIDQGCSICSGVAASCLILDHQQAEAGSLLKWLRDKADEHYCWRREDRFAGAPPGNHALHYAAMALQAFVDQGINEEDNDVRNILNLFFQAGTAKPDQYPDRWTKYLNTSIYDFSTYVFHAFARYLLAGGHLETAATPILRRALQTLAQWLRKDAEGAILGEEDIGRIYPARENMGSLALGLVIDAVPEVDEPIVSYNLRRFAAYAETDLPPTIRARTIDSNLDRIRKMLEGWLLQIESALYRRERGWDVPAYLTTWLGIAGERHAGGGDD